jgi:AmmeMemoRadiSam system protein A
MSLSAEIRASLLRLARTSLLGHVGRPTAEPASTDLPVLDERRGAFVTLHRHGELRGCVGSIVGVDPLRDAIPSLARAAASNDSRFAPLTGDEVDDVDIEISLLSPLRRIDSPVAIEVGRHGLVVRRGPWRGLLLPQVAAERGWDAETFLSWTCRKAGLDENAWREWAAGRDNDLTVEIFSAEVFGETDAGRS